MAILEKLGQRSCWILVPFLAGCNLLFSDAKIVAGDDQDALCSDYCGTIGETCMGENAQYNATKSCLEVCDTLDVGNVDDEIGNTVNCRLHYALEASEDPNTHCTAAGPGGNGVCGSNCESFCHIQDAVCFGENEQYPTITDCIAACGAFDASAVFNSEVLSGDTFACRLTHLTLAAASPDVHCPHIAPVSEVCR